MYKKILIIIFLPYILAACIRDEPELNLFHLSLATEADAYVAMGLHSAEVTISGDARWIEVGIEGEIDSYSISDEIPDWLTISNSEMVTIHNYFRINVSALNGDDTRVGKVSFTIVKGCNSQTGSIMVIQNPSTLEDLKKTEQRATLSLLKIRR